MDRTQSRFDERLKWLCAIVLLGWALFALVYAANTARLPMQFDYEEGNILNAGLRITHGQTPYPQPSSWPIVLDPYGPLPYLLTALWVKWFGISFFVPRLTSIACGALIAGSIGALIRRFGGSLPVSIIFACAFLSVPSIRNWLLTCRVDWLALALSLGGLAACVFLEKRWYVAALLFSAALFVKYSLIAAPLACGLWFLLRRDWKTAARLAAASAALCVIGFWLTQRWSGGNFAFHQFGTHPDPYVFAQYIGLMKERVAALPALFGTALIAVGGDLVRKTRSLPAIYFLTSTAGALTLGKVGSNTNHLIEWTAAVCLCAGYGWRYVESWLLERRLLVADRLANVALFSTLLLVFFLYRLPMEQATSCGATYTFLQSHGDNVLTDSVGALVLAGKPVLVSNPFVYTQLVSHGAWPDTVKDRVTEKKFDVILLRDQLGAYRPDNRFTRNTLLAIRQNYHEGAAFECFDSTSAYVPNP